MKKVLICDDDIFFAEGIKQDVLEIMGRENLHVETFVLEEQLEFYVAEHPDEPAIVMLDVKLKNNNGVNVAKNLQRANPDTQIIFMSGYDDYYLDVYEVEHIYFLKKPVKRQRLKQALSRAIQRLEQIKEANFHMPGRIGTEQIPLSIILYFEKEKRKIHIHSTEKRYSFYGRFEEIEEQLDERFLRCHNSYIVNIAKAQKLSDKKFFFENGRAIPISKSYYGQARNKFLDYLSNSL